MYTAYRELLKIRSEVIEHLVKTDVPTKSVLGLLGRRHLEVYLMIYLSLFIISSVLSLQSAVIVTFSEAATATPSKFIDLTDGDNCN